MDYQKPKRRRINPTHRWRDEETVELINGVLDTVRHNPESFEKPTGQRFYEKIKENSKHIKHMSWAVLKNKMRNLKSGYIAAVQWQSHTGSRLLANGETKTVEDYIRKMCPYFGLMDEIFQESQDVSTSIVTESTNSADLLHFEDFKIDFDANDSEHDNSSDTSSNCDLLDEKDLMNDASKTSLASNDNEESYTKKLVSMKKIRQENIRSSNSVAMLLSVQDKILDLERKKFQWQIIMDKKRLELKKLELQQQYDFRKLELQKRERLEREKIKLKNETEERIRKFELELKYDLK